MSRKPVIKMLTATRIAMIESSTKIPVAQTTISPVTTATEVQTSVKQVLAVGFEDDGVLAAADADQDQADDQVDADATSATSAPSPSAFNGAGWISRSIATQAVPIAGDDDEDAFQSGGKELDLLVPVGVRRVHGPLRVAQGKVSRQSGKQVDAGLEGVGQETDGPGEPLGGRLQADGEDRGKDRQQDQRSQSAWRHPGPGK